VESAAKRARQGAVKELSRGSSSGRTMKRMIGWATTRPTATIESWRWKW
jgi:hypothetical protein